MRMSISICKWHLGRRLLGAVVALCAAWLLLPVHAGAKLFSDQEAADLEGVGVDENLDGQLPLDAVFLDSEGNQVKLGDYFNNDRPVILTLNYYVCPMLCGLMINGMVDGLKELDFEPGKDYDIVTISFNPVETPKLAKLKKQNYVKYFGRQSAHNWHFLTGTQANIDAVTEAVGFKYKWVEDTQEYAHAAVVNVCTPEGHISRYLYGVMFEPRTLRMALVEASQGKIGTTVDRVLLFCLHYDPDAGTYNASVMNITRLVGIATVIILLIILVPAWLAGRSRKQRKAAAAAAGSGGTAQAEDGDGPANESREGTDHDA